MGALRKTAVPPRSKLTVVQAYQQHLAEKEQAARQARIIHYGTNPMQRWVMTYGQHDMVHQDGPHKGEFVSPADFHLDLTAEIHRKLTGGFFQPRICGVLSRDGAKSTYGTKWTTLYAVAECGKRNVIIICASKDEAKRRIDSIIGELETNERLLQDYPELTFAKDSKSQWVSNTDYEITLANGATIKAYDFGGKLRGRNVRGARVDLVILDDPETEDHEYSELKRTRDWHWLQAVVLRAMTDYALLIWLGTPVGNNALLERARNSSDDEENPGFGWDGPVVPIAVELDGKGNDLPWTPEPRAIPWKPTPPKVVEQILEHDPDSAEALVAKELAEARRWYRPRWESRYTALDVAYKLNEGDPNIAQQELMCRPVNREDSPFDIDWFDSNQIDHKLLKRIRPGVWTYDNVRLGQPQAHIDSAGSASPQADHTAIVVGARHPQTKKIIVLKMYYRRIEVPEQLDLLNEMHEHYGCRVITGQTSHFEKAVEQFNRRQGSLPLKLKPLNNSANSKDRRIRNSAVHYSSGRLQFNPGDDEQKHLRTEMKFYDGKGDDLLDAMEELMAEFDDCDGADFDRLAEIQMPGLSPEAQSMRSNW